MHSISIYGCFALLVCCNLATGADIAQISSSGHINPITPEDFYVSNRHRQHDQHSRLMRKSLDHAKLSPQASVSLGEKALQGGTEHAVELTKLPDSSSIVDSFASGWVSLLQKRDDKLAIALKAWEINLKRHGVLSHELTAGQGFIDSWAFFLAFASFSLAAVISFVIEAKRIQSQALVSISRDNFLDIAKFILITLVLADHADLGYPATSRHAYAWKNSTMPAFFIISGIVSKWGEGLRPRKELIRSTLRDCVLNNILWMLFMSCPPLPGPTCPPIGLWFLVALAVYRIVVGFAFQFQIRTLGSWLGSLMTLMETIVLTWAWMNGGRISVIPSFPFAYEANCVVVHAPFYALGLIFQTCGAHRFLKTSGAFAAAATLSCAWWYSVAWMMSGEQTSLYGGWLSCMALGDYHADESIVQSPSMWLWTLVVKAVLALALIAMAGPFTRFQAVSDFVARLGCRSLYGYVLQITILHGIIGWGAGIRALGWLYAISPLFAICGLCCGMAVLCSPLSEATFGWLLCPTWALPRAKADELGDKK